MSLYGYSIVSGVVCLMMLELSGIYAFPLGYSQIVAMHNPNGVSAAHQKEVSSAKVVHKRDVWSAVDQYYGRAPFSNYESDFPVYEDSLPSAYEELRGSPQKRLRFVAQNVHPGRRLSGGNPTLTGSRAPTPGTPQTPVVPVYPTVPGLNGQKFRFHRG